MGNLRGVTILLLDPVPYYIRMYVRNERIFEGLQFVLNKIIFEQNIKRICSLLNKALFGTLCIPFGQLFESHLVFEVSVKSAILTFLSKIHSK